MATIPHPGLANRSTDMVVQDVPEQVTIALRELASAAKEGLLAFSSAATPRGYRIPTHVTWIASPLQFVMMFSLTETRVPGRSFAVVET
jgi:hypothetical protein